MKYMSDNKNQAWILKLEKSSVHSLVIVLSWYHHQPESHQQSFTKFLELETDTGTHRPDPRDTWVR